MYLNGYISNTLMLWLKPKTTASLCSVDVEACTGRVQAKPHVRSCDV